RCHRASYATAPSLAHDGCAPGFEQTTHYADPPHKSHTAVSTPESYRPQAHFLPEDRAQEQDVQPETADRVHPPPAFLQPAYYECHPVHLVTNNHPEFPANLSKNHS